MNQEMEDPDTYHQDFTTASEWEVFVDRLERIINKWKLTQPTYYSPIQKGDLEGDWETKTEEIQFADEIFTLAHWSLKGIISSPLEEGENISSSSPQALTDMMAIAGDFNKVPTCPPVAQMYGIRNFLLLTPCEKAAVSSETKAKILLSSVTMAISSCGCDVPIFVQLLEPWQNFYLGSCAGKNVTAEYEMVHLQRTPPHCKYLTGLLETFKAKISRGQQVPPILISACLTYKLRLLRPWCAELLLDHKGRNESSLGQLSVGTVEDPISELHLLATWPQLNDQMVVDSPSYSDLEPMQAPLWAVRVGLVKDKVIPRLAQNLNFLIKLASEPLDPLISACPREPKLSHSLDALTESRVPTISKVIGRVRASANPHQGTDKRRSGAIPESQLVEFVYYLFPDATEDPTDPYHNIFAKATRPDIPAQLACMEGIKSVPPEGLVWRLALLLPLVFARGGINSAAQLWFEFTEEMRYRWEHGHRVPGVLPGFADHKTCVLNQKLQMLNICTERKIAREAAHHKHKPASETADSECDEDEFFDCDATESPDESMHDATSEARGGYKTKHSLWNQPEGRQSEHPTLRLLNTGEPLYVPVTQDLVPKTEDELETSELSQAKAYMMSATLSDMESFKAANPSAVLEDFIRWYSPRDWVEDPSGELDQWGQPKGQLSARMQLQDNTWLELWGVAQPVPAKRQRRLFDETRSAELVLTWLESLSARAVAATLLPVLAHACALRILHETESLVGVLPDLAGAVDRLVKRVVDASREPVQTVKTYQKLVTDIADVERQISRYKSLCSKFYSAGSEPGTDKELMDFVTNLMTLKEVPVPGGPRGAIGTNLRNMFAEAQKVAQMLPDIRPEVSNTAEFATSLSTFPPAETKEMIMRVVAPRPGPTSRPSPQRMYALHRRDEFRLAGCFSRDVLFY